MIMVKETVAEIWKRIVDDEDVRDAALTIASAVGAMLILVFARRLPRPWLP
jgi:hypothetical protein